MFRRTLFLFCFLFFLVWGGGGEGRHDAGVCRETLSPKPGAVAKVLGNHENLNPNPQTPKKHLGGCRCGRLRNHGPHRLQREVSLLS